MYGVMAQYYDRIYAFKDYAEEAGQVVSWIDAHVRSDGTRLLDVACGTGMHLEYLSKSFTAEGLDISEELLAFARQRNPDLTFHCGDMRNFDLQKRFDVVTCLFSSIGYMTTIEDLNAAVTNMARHLVPGGVLLIEPWIRPEGWMEGSVHGLFVDDPGLKIARVNSSERKGNLSIFDLHHLVGTPEKTFHFVEHHEMLLATDEELTSAFVGAGLEITIDQQGLMDRGMYIGVKPRND